MSLRDQGLRQAGLRQMGDPVAPKDQSPATKVMRRGVASSTTFGTYDLIYPWGMLQNFQGWGVSGGALDPINVLNAYPHIFPIGLTIKNILIKNNVGAALTKLKIGIYSDVGNGVPYPSALIWEQAEVSPLAIGITTFTPNLAVPAGRLLWAVVTCDNTAANINLSGVSAGAVVGPALLGTIPAMTAEANIGWQIVRTYDGLLPATFPTASPLLLTTGNPPALMMRFA